MRYLKLILFTSFVLIIILWMLPYKSASQSGLKPLECSFLFSEDTADVSFSSYYKDGYYTIKDTIDLKGKTWYIPAASSLVFDGGLIRNGCIIGNETKIDYKQTIFDSILIKGSWVVPTIRSSMFKTLSYDNSLKDVFALANPLINNHIEIEEGIYNLTATTNSEACLRIGSNADIVIEGSIQLKPNDFTNYSIFHLTGDNIKITGAGCIAGDKLTHTGNKGEWGMGIYISGGSNISIQGITVKDCWGDCVYVTKNAKNVVIEDCIIDNGRRQGISIISAQNVLIRNCSIRNINGTNPAYAIDVEPNKGDKIADVLIENVAVNNCRGGFASYGKARDAHIGKVVIKNCTVEKTEQIPLSFVSTNSIEVDDCRITCSRVKQAIECFDVDDVSLKSIRFDGRRIRNNRRGKKLISVKNFKRQIIQ